MNERTKDRIVWVGLVVSYAILGCLALCVALGIHGCRSVVPVVQVNTTMQCQVTESSAGGAIRMDCKVDGHKVDAPVTGPSGTGDDTVKVEPPETSWTNPGPEAARLN